LAATGEANRLHGLRINDGEGKQFVVNLGLSNVRLIERQDSAHSLPRSQISQPRKIFQSAFLAGFDQTVIEVLNHKNSEVIKL